MSSMDLLRHFRSLSVRGGQLSSTQCVVDRSSRQLSIYGWSQCLTAEVVIALTVTDEADQLEWTWTSMIESGTSYRRLHADEPFQVKIPSSSLGHEIVVNTRTLRRTSDSGGESADVECYEVTSESSCTTRTSFAIHAGAKTSSFSVFDVRPRLKSNVGIGGGSAMLSILTARSLLPTKASKSFTCTGDSVRLEIYQGDSSRISRNKRVHGIELDESDELEKTITVNLDVTKDGTLKTVVSELGYEDTNGTVAARIIDVICPKIAVDTTDPELDAQWTQRIVLLRKAVLVIKTTYAEIHRWRVSIAAAGVATGNCGHVFLMPRDGFNQRFDIPSNILEVGVRYKVTVEGLQLVDDGANSSRNFRIICRNTVTLEAIQLPARTATAGRRTPLDDLTLSSLSLTSARPQRSSALQVNIDLRIQIERSTFHQASVIISTIPRAAGTNRKWKIGVRKIATATGTVLYYNLTKEFVAEGQRFDFPLQFQAGHRYRVTVAPKEGFDDGVYQNPDNIVNQTAEFRAELTLEDIKKLYRMAVSHTAGYGSLSCQRFYRNKPPSYFRDINLNHAGIMKVYNKDNSGDPASPINLQIKGLFFMASVDNRTGRPPTDSPFGSTRIYMEAENMLQMASHLYFVDYYCMLGKAHYVTLVMTKPGSATDRFCAERLMLLSVDDPSENPFFFRDHLGRLKVSAAHYLWVEVLFTEDVDTRDGVFQLNMPTVGKGSSTPEGIPKNSQCPQCNLNRYTGLEQF